MSRKKLFTFFVVALCLAALTGLLYMTHERPYSEAESLSDMVLTENGYTDYFSRLAEEKGSLYAFEVLRRIKLPAGVNVHSVAHGIGYILYEEKGISGIYDCTEEFRSACAHAVVIRALSENGPNAKSEIIRACEAAPGGRGAYAICFHGVGHGFVASNDYDFRSAVVQCAEISDSVNRVSSGHRFMSAREECIGGAVMEMVQGAHNTDAWERAASLYLPMDDTFRPCTDEYVPESLRSACLLSLTQRFFGAAGIAEDIPLPETYPEAMGVCATVSGKDNQTACYGGFGKEFVFYSTQFDGGDVNRLSEGALARIRDWCAYADTSSGVTRCLSTALDTLFWAGENNPRSAAHFCSVLSGSDRTECYKGFIENIRFFLVQGERLERACGFVPPEFREACTLVETSTSEFLFITLGFGTMRL